MVRPRNDYYFHVLSTCSDHFTHASARHVTGFSAATAALATAAAAAAAAANLKIPPPSGRSLTAPSRPVVSQSQASPGGFTLQSKSVLRC